MTFKLIKSATVVPGCMLILCSSFSAFAQRPVVPRLMTEFKVVAEEGNKRAAFTPALAPRGVGFKELGKGQIIGVLETSNIKNVPNGTYHLSIEKVGDDWEAALSSFGKSVFKTKQVTVTPLGEKTRSEMVRPVVKLNFNIHSRWDNCEIDVSW